MPTLEPRFDGFTKHGKPVTSRTRRATGSGRSRHSRRSTTVYSTIGSPCAENTAFIVALSMPTAEASTPAPTYGTSASSSSPWIVPSSPYGPWSMTTTTSRPARNSAGMPPRSEASTPAPTYGTSASSSSPWIVPSSPYGPWSMTTTTSRPARNSAGMPPAGSTRTSAVEASAVSALSARSASAFLTAPVASPLGRPTRACEASARRGSPPTTQRPSRPIPMGTTVWPRRSSAAITEAAEASETSCSPDRPPKITPTRSGAMPRILAGAEGRPLAACVPRRGHFLDESVCHESAILLRNSEEFDPVAGPDRVTGPGAELADVNADGLTRMGLDEEFPGGDGHHPARDPPDVLAGGRPGHDGVERGGRRRRGGRQGRRRLGRRLAGQRRGRGADLGRRRHRRRRKTQRGIARADDHGGDFVGPTTLDAHQRHGAGDGFRAHAPGAADVGVVEAAVITAHHDERLGGQGRGPLEIPAQRTRVTGGGHRGPGDQEDGGGGEGAFHRAPPDGRFA